MAEEVAERDPWATGSDFYRQQVLGSCRLAIEFAERLEAGDARVLPRVRSLWIEAELPSYCPHAWSRLWAAVQQTANRSHVMSRTERRRLRTLDDPVTIFRGARAGGERGWSWTLQRSVALDFAVRYSDPDDAPNQARLCTAHVRVADIIAYFQHGGEDELIIDPRTIERLCILGIEP